MTKICLKCNEEYDDSHNFCQSCGAELSEVKSEEKNEKGFFAKMGVKKREGDDEWEKKKQKKREKWIKEEMAKKQANRTTTEKEYGFYFEDMAQQFKEDAKKADSVYKAYVTSGVSRLEKINGRFLASQLIKLDILNKQNKRIIEQNDAIIDLLTQLVNK